jgi:hypothetical protein
LLSLWSFVEVVVGCWERKGGSERRGIVEERRQQ